MADELTRLAAELQALRAEGIGGAVVDEIEIEGVVYTVRLDTVDEEQD